MCVILEQALYTLARSKTSELSTGAGGGLTAEAATAGLAFLTHNGTWLGMIAEGATATMEVWTKDDKPNLSWSHPWCSAPANIVPRRLMGVQPLAPGFKHFEVVLQPGVLAWATLSLPTVPGVGTQAIRVPVLPESILTDVLCCQTIQLAFNQSSKAFSANLTVPSGSTAWVCLPPPTATVGEAAAPVEVRVGEDRPLVLSVRGRASPDHCSAEVPDWAPPLVGVPAENCCYRLRRT